MANRQQRRAAAKKKPSWQRMTTEQRKAALIKNGITPQDLEKAYNDGYDIGWKNGLDGSYKTCFAAVCMALGDVNGFDREKMLPVLQKMEEYIINSFTSAEAINDVFQRFGLEIDFGEPMNTIQFDD